jgi:hypothetical protein
MTQSHLKSLPNTLKLYLWILLSLLATSSLAQFGGGGMGAGMGRRGGMGQGRVDQSAGNGTVVSNPMNLVPEQIVQELSTLEFDLRLSQEQLPQWMMFSDRVRAYIDDQIRMKLKEQNNSILAQGKSLGLQYLAQTVSAEQNKFTDLEDIEIQAKLLYPMLNSDQKLLMDLRMSKIVAPNLFFNSYPPNKATAP